VAAYYNEFDPKAAAWLRELIKEGHLPSGDVDERSILEVQAEELVGYAQCHFFAGIGGWPLALRLAGWPEDHSTWSGSPPCQPFSSAGLHKGKDDERHLAPHFLGLVSSGRPAVLFGEQVSTSAVFGKAAISPRIDFEEEPEWAWIDDVLARLEAALYAFGAADLPASSVGTPNPRNRTFFGAVDTERPLREVLPRLAHADDAGLQGPERSWTAGEEGAPNGHHTERCRRVLSGGRGVRGGPPRWDNPSRIAEGGQNLRPHEPGTLPLAHGVSASVGRLCGYGNAIVPELGATFIESFVESYNQARADFYRISDLV